MVVQTVPTPQQRKSLPSRGIKTSTPIWMEEKRTRDQELWGSNNKNLWIMENKMYDLTSYINKHPGGESWIRLTQGQDITEHFIVHHLRENIAREVLAKYYVADCPTLVNRFTFQQDSFYRTLKKRVLEKFTVKQIQNETISKRYGYLILSLWLICLSLVAVTHSYFLSLLCAPLMVGLVGVGHNFVHHKQSPYRYFFLLTGFTHRQWQIMHCISHHLYPNTELDYEIAAFEPFGYYLRSMPQNKWYFQPLLQVLMVFVQPINMILKIIIVPIIKKTKPDFLYSFPLFVLAYLWFCNDSFIGALKLYSVIYCSFGFLLMKVLFCGHRVGDTWTEGAQKIQDFGEHTIRATSDTDVGIQGIWSFILLAGFNIHIAHHFFPTADHHILPKINVMIRELCQERGIKKNEKTRLECMSSLAKTFINRQPYNFK